MKHGDKMHIFKCKMSIVYIVNFEKGCNQYYWIHD